MFAVIFIGLAAVQNGDAQAPSFVWRANIGANLLAVDSQTNVYANSGSTIFTLNSLGIPVQTNVFNQPASVVQRDAAGNYYFAGTRPAGPASGYNGSDYGTTNACFLTKYTAGGTLVWSNGFGPTGLLKYITLTDLQIDTNGNAYAGYYYNITTADFYAMLAKLDSSGSTQWNVAMPKSSTGSTVGAIYATVLSPTNGFALTYASRFTGGPGPNNLVLSSFDNNGTATIVTNWSSDSSVAVPLSRDAAGNFYTRETNITKRAASGDIVWHNPLLFDYPVGADPAGGVYTSSGGTYILTRYDANGNVTWNTNFSYHNIFWCTKVTVDGSGNRFLSLSDGSIACIAGPSLRLNSQAGDGMTPQGFRFSFVSDPNATVKILSSSDLNTWNNLGWVTNQTGVTQVLDPSAVNSSYKFYRFTP